MQRVVHLVVLIILGMNQDRYIELGIIERIGDPRFITEVRKVDDAIKFVAMLIEQSRTLVGIFQCLDRSGGSSVFRQDHSFKVQLLQFGQELLPARPG